MTDVATTQQVQAQLAFNTEAEIKRLTNYLKTAWAKLAEDLYRFHDLEMWRDLGHESFESWLADPDIGLERRWVYYLIEFWRELVVHRGVDPKRLEWLQPSKIQAVLPAIRRNFVSADDALEDVAQLSRSDLKERYGTRGADGGRPDTSTRYDAGSEPSYVICPTCGQRAREEDLRA